MIAVFVIDEFNRTITATEYRELPVLFYYWTGSRNRPYRSQKMYGMAKDFKPKAGQITPVQYHRPWDSPRAGVCQRGSADHPDGAGAVPDSPLYCHPWFQAPAAQNTPYCAV